MKLVGKKNIKFYLLLCVVVLVWGMIFSKIYSHYTQNEENVIKLTDNSIDKNLVKINYINEKDEQLEYVKLSKDPFTFTKIRKKKKTVNSNIKKTEVPKETIEFSINGVIINKNSKMLILNDVTNNQTVFLREGEKYKYIKIKSIKQTSVTFLEYNDLKTLQINQ